MNLGLLFEQSFAIQLHVYTAVLAFGLGSFVLWRKKGTKIHKLLGKVWVLIMVVTALSSLFIHQIKLWGNFSPIHLISVGVIIGLWVGVLQARKGDIENHQRSMKGVYIGGLVIAGGLSFVPGRLMFEIALAPMFNKLLSATGISAPNVSDGLNVIITFVGLLVAILIVNRKSIVNLFSNWNIKSNNQKLLK